MYQTCLFCHAALGSNETIEHFPIGRRLAFDAAKGRLWVVCRKCARWNLTPLEERWEAIEECERAFASTRMRVSTDNVGLARVGDGLELVRIGQPQRPELAAWRYGDQFGRRRRKHMIYTGALVAAGLGSLITGPGMGLAIGTAFSLVNSGGSLLQMIHRNRVRARIHVPGHERPAVVRQSLLSKVAIVSEADRWHLRLRYDRGILIDREIEREVTIEGDAAIRAAATILAVSNESGAGAKQVRSAVDIISGAPDPASLFVRATRVTWKVDRLVNRWTVQQTSFGTGPAEAPLTQISPEMLLALEMAANEDVERRAMEGELALLEEAWRQAEEIAGIADDLTLPESAAGELKKLADDSGRKAGN